MILMTELPRLALILHRDQSVIMFHELNVLLSDVEDICSGHEGNDHSIKGPQMS